MPNPGMTRGPIPPTKTDWHETSRKESPRLHLPELRRVPLGLTDMAGELKQS